MAVDAPSANSVSSYARWRASTLGRITEQIELDVVFELAGPLQGLRVLDVGTGDGSYAIKAARRGADVVGLDTDTSMLAAADKRASEQGIGIVFREGRVESLPFEDATFDVVFAVTVLCFVQEPERSVAEMSRVLVPGGRLVLGELGRWSLWATSRRVRGWLGGSRTWHDAHFWSRRDLVELVRAAGLDVRRVQGSVFYPPLTIAARVGQPFDRVLGRLRAPGAAFLAVAGTKKGSPNGRRTAL